ncbi:MAG: serine hydrolase [Bdellovibrionales bacterium]
MKHFFILFSYFIFSTAFAQPLTPELTGKIERYFNATLQQSKGAGVAVAIVKDHEVIFMKGFGYRDVEQKLPVTSKTLFGIGSTTKAFTSTLLGILSDTGQLNLDQPIVEYIPSFQLLDSEATKSATLVDLLTHQTGVPRHDFAWYKGEFSSRAEMFQLLRFLDPSAKFREKWQYNNWMYMASGYIAEIVAGRTWESLVAERILSPLKMTTTNFSVIESQKSQDYALPYIFDESGPKRTQFVNIDLIGPAGSINSNLEDMSQWLKFQLHRGLFGERRLISGSMLARIHTPVVNTLSKKHQVIKELGAMKYALGWNVTTYRGRRFIEHTGGIDGFLTFVGFLPDSKLGVVVLSNSYALDGMPLGLYAIDQALSLPEVDWFKRFRDLNGKTTPPPPLEYQPPPRPLRDYVGNYRHRVYGEVFISLSQVDGEQLRIKFHGMEFALKHVSNNRFYIVGGYTANEASFLSFQLDANPSLGWKVEPTLPAIQFVR